jgi:hypothetical protein
LEASKTFMNWEDGKPCSKPLRSSMLVVIKYHFGHISEKKPEVEGNKSQEPISWTTLKTSLYLDNSRHILGYNLPHDGCKRRLRRYVLFLRISKRALLIYLEEIKVIDI